MACYMNVNWATSQKKQELDSFSSKLQQLVVKYFHLYKKLDEMFHGEFITGEESQRLSSMWSTQEFELSENMINNLYKEYEKTKNKTSK